MAIGLFFVSLISWWYWPRGDARFLGKWNAIVNGQLPGVMTFHRHGRGSFLAPDHNSIFSWCVEGQELVIGNTERFEPSRTMQVLTDLYTRFTGIIVANRLERIDFVQHSPEEILVGDALKLTRIPE